MKGGPVFRRIMHRFSGQLRQRGKTLKSFGATLGLVHFGTVHQHDDEYDAIRGFTASLTHRDTHYAVGTYNGYNIRLVNRFDIVKVAGNPHHEQLWTIIEIDLEKSGIPHVFFVPTGKEAGEYGHIYATHPTMQPLNSMLLHNKSPEFHGRFQILASPSHSHAIEQLFPSPLIVGLAGRFWPHGFEIQRGKLLVYITEHRLTKTVLETALASGLWLAETIDEVE